MKRIHYTKPSVGELELDYVTDAVRNGWGERTRKLTEFAFYLRGHWLRMPPLMLVRHLWTKWRKGYRPAG